jgi:hypothetical protein
LRSLTGTARRSEQARVEAHAGQEGLKELEIESAIRALKAQYFICLDLKDWSCFRSVFTDDVVFRIFEPGMSVPAGEFTGADTMVATTRESVKDAMTVHHGHEPLIEVMTDTTARATWPAEGLMRKQVNGSAVTRHAFNFYRETYKKGRAYWKIASSDLLRQFYEWRIDDPISEQTYEQF